MTELLLITILIVLLIILILIVNIRKNSSINSSEKQFGDFSRLVSEGFSKTEKEIRSEFAGSRAESDNRSMQLRSELSSLFKALEDSLLNRIIEISRLQKSQLDIFSDNLIKLSRTVDERIESYRKLVETKFDSFQLQQSEASRQTRTELSDSLKALSDTIQNHLTGLFQLQKDELSKFSSQVALLIQSNDLKFEQLKEKVQEKLSEMQENNSQKLEEMRLTVDEKLQSTLEKRLGESFRLVSERLEMVHRGLGEMQNLANGVGDLKRVLANIKTRGTWGEVQLGSLIEQILSPEQYSKNIATKKDSSCIVEYAVKMPGRGSNDDEVLWLPIDAKFPLEDYQRLCEAQDSAETVLIEESARALENRIKSEAREIKEKYLDPPNTTDFAILFLPVEGLYAEVLRRPGLCDKIQHEYRVILAGPTTLTAILSSLQMGFRTLAIEKRSSEVWSLLGMVKTEFSHFGTILDKTRKKLQEASNTIENASAASRRIERKLKDVQALPAKDGLELLIEEEGQQ